MPSTELIVPCANMVTLTRDTLALPDTVEGCYEVFRTQSLKLETVNSLVYWQLGGVLNKLKQTFEIEKPEEAVAREAGIGERHLRYCAATFDAFDGPQLNDLCSRGMQWSTVRELAADSVADFRERLVELFLIGRISDNEVRDFVTKLRNGTAMSVLIDADGKPVVSADGEAGGPLPDARKQFETMRKKTIKRAKDFTKDSSAFRTELAGRFSDVLIGPDGDDNEVAKELSDTEDDVIAALTEAIELIRDIHLMCARGDYPFDTIDSRLEELRAEFGVGAGEPAAVQSSEQ